MFSSVHVHTNFCDGDSSPEQVAESAYRKGIKVLGFSGHTYDPVYNYGITPEKLPIYKSEILRLKELYRGKLDILCGIEYDPVSPEETPLEGWDYMIGSCHNAMAPNGRYYSVDGYKECITDALKDGFENDIKALIESYFKGVIGIFSKVTPDIVGHFDLVKKTNIVHPFFDENAEWYKAVALDTLDFALDRVKLFEVNTGAVSRGYRNDVYPEQFLLKRIREKGGKVIITADSHSPDTLDFFYKEACDFVRRAGFTELAELSAEGVITHPF